MKARAIFIFMIATLVGVSAGTIEYLGGIGGGGSGGGGFTANAMTTERFLMTWDDLSANASGTF